LDTSFTPSLNGTVNAIAIQSDGKIVVGGIFSSPYNNVARFHSSGALDTTFNPGAGPDDKVRAVAVQTDGRILIGGSFFYLNSYSIHYLARLNSNGSVDTGFVPNPNDAVYTIALQADAKIVVGGWFTTIAGASRNRIARLNTSGSNDSSFAPGTGASSIVYSAAIQNDGRILIGGAFTSFNGTSRNRIARLTSTGPLDTTFNPGTGANNVVYSVALQANGRVLLGGSFTTVDGFGLNRIARLEANGTRDATFSPGSGAEPTPPATSADVKSVVLQADAKILIGGTFTKFNGATRNRVARLYGD
jgi:uncharacterized delta-60 repeat protein